MAPLVVIVDFTLVLGMDSSAAHAVAKLKKITHRLFHVDLSIFVTGSDRGGFPCEFALSEALSPAAAESIQQAAVHWNDVPATDSDHIVHQSPKAVKRGSISLSAGTASIKASSRLTQNINGTVCESLDDALKFAEDILIARENPSLHGSSGNSDLKEYTSINMTIQEEKYFGKKFMRELLPNTPNIEANIDIMLSHMVREEYTKDQILWEEGDNSTSLKLLVCGELVSVLEDTGALEMVENGNIMGELGLVQGTSRLTTLICASEKAVLYSLSKVTWNMLQNEHHGISTLISGLVIRYLAHRVQHVNNRYFHTTLPV
jgi:SulP family sulfate permease